ncbi:ester cyclase [Mycolicibacterium goodii]|uniref:ester cyclase n=1 Tax=Mycolicibacterium goodii TaxID=134601 RepID=UPI001BDBDF61|nr:ester cyclase [Mycolicibacterium goodii]MBU8829402.1 ester cyclase [Mycolicibacterium goodii]ULN46639.1 ester cyclase [Mycolicibacterium goodii]
MTEQKERLRSLYQSYLDACNEHDFDRMTTFYASTIRINDAPTPAENVTRQFVPLVRAFPDWRWKVRSQLVDDDLIALHFSVTGTHLGDFRGIAATGRRVSTSEFTVYRVEDCKFTDVWDLTDFDTVMDQIRQNPTDGRNDP